MIQAIANIIIVIAAILIAFYWCAENYNNNGKK